MSLELQSMQPMATMSELIASAELEMETETFESANFPQGKLQFKTQERHISLMKSAFSKTAENKIQQTLTFSSPVKTLATPAELYTNLAKNRSSSRLSPNKTANHTVDKNSANIQSSFASSNSFRAQTVQNTHFSKHDPVNHAKASTRRSQENSKPYKDAASSARQRKWQHEETMKWWEMRYHQKDKEGQKERHGRDQEQEQQKESEKNKIKGASISKTGRRYVLEKESQGQVPKPQLVRPKLGVFALFYILTKMGIHSDGTGNFFYKKEIEYVDAETSKAHQDRLKEMQEALKKEQSANRWGAALKVFTWIGTMMGVIAGAAMIVSGVGAVAGAMLLTAGIIQITNQILEVTGGWHKIAEKLPGNDPDKKRAVITWIQMGIAILCLILSGAGGIWGGLSNLKDSMQIVGMAMGAIAAVGDGICTIGNGVTGYLHKDHLSEVKRYDYKLARLKHQRKDLMEKVDLGADRLERLFEDLAKALEFEVELFRADQMINRT